MGNRVCDLHLRVDLGSVCYHRECGVHSTANRISHTIPLVADASQLEHGWRVFAANLWNGLDAAIIL